MDKTNKFINVRITPSTFDAIRKIATRSGEKQYRALERIVVAAEKNERPKRNRK